VRVTFGEQGRGVKAEAWAVANPSTRCMHASLLPKILTTNVKKNTEVEETRIYDVYSRMLLLTLSPSITILL
jgi:hypothetical protein